MLLARAVPIVGVAAVLAVSAPAAATPAAAAGSSPDVSPVLTSTPFASPPGQRVTHTITLSATGTGALTAVRVTFTTTVGLDGVTATASAGSCPIVTPLTVVCDVGNVDFSDGSASGAGAAAVPKVTIAGVIHSGTAPGTLVQNLVNVTSGTPDADPANNVASNAYLVAGGSTAPTSAPTSSPALARPSSGKARGVNLVPVTAVLALAVAAMTTLIVVRRRRSLSSGNNHLSNEDNHDV